MTMPIEWLAQYPFPPGLILILGGVLMPLLPAAFRPAAVLGLPLASLVIGLNVPDGVLLYHPFIGFELELVQGDRLSRLFSTIFSIMAFAGGLYAFRHSKVMELSAAFVYAGAAIGVAFSGDLITMFIFWEIMAIGSTLVIWSARTKASQGAAMRYLAVHLFGGVVLMAGIVAHVNATGSVEFAAVKLDSLGAWLMLIGFLVNAGAPPFSSWIPDAYPESSPFGMVFLSAFTTKTAVFVLIRTFAGAEVLIYVGVYMACYGIIYALLENDMRRILAYSIVNQVGFMICGIGIGTEMAINGASAHAFAHIIYKALLIMSAGAVLQQTGKRKCTDLGGLFQSMPLTCICGTIGALAISSFPWTSGFVSKSMINTAAATEHLAFVWYVLMAASAGVFLHAGIKFPWFVFFQKDSGMRPPDPAWNMKAAMILFAFLCIGLGVYPEPLYALLPYKVDYEPYTFAHVAEMLQLLLFSGLAFFLLLPMMKRTLTISLDFDWFYRVAGPFVVGRLVQAIAAVGTAIETALTKTVLNAITVIRRHHGPEGFMAKTLHLSSMVFWVIAALAFVLILDFARGV
jgi:multicomponent Na+:H+ antiporter subunit D